MKKTRHEPVTRPAVRCAIYTRKSTEDGLEQEFNSLDAQRESSEAYIRSQASEGWQIIPTAYDDGGFTGGNMDRPGLKRLMADIDAGKVDCVVVYKVDRLSRSLLDFSRIVEAFDRHGVAFVSVTQQFNTANSMGRLMLNVLLSFAQFEREIISERTRDKIAATRRKGKWTGGMPLLGYDVDPRGPRLVVNNDEAARVRQIFELYIDHQSLLSVVKELEERRWNSKVWLTKKGISRGGRPFDKTSLYKLLTNVTYIGDLRYKAEIHKGEHDGIVDRSLFDQVQTILRRNAVNRGADVRNRFGAILGGLLRCVGCDAAMSPAHTTKNGTKRYRYYVCSAAQKKGWHSCTTKSVPAGEMERFVVSQIRGLTSDRDFVEETVAACLSQQQTKIVALQGERRSLERDLELWQSEISRVLESGDTSTTTAQRIAVYEGRLRETSQQLQNLAEQHSSLKASIEANALKRALADFDEVWNVMPSRHQKRILQLLIRQIDYDGASGRIAIHFHPHGFTGLAESLNQREELK
ncbi:MAG: DNA-invertase hin [Planctomycetota bacterium]